ncbi:MAG: hypothetical protein AAFO77_01685 [Pseudomonadota bacterium]
MAFSQGKAFAAFLLIAASVIPISGCQERVSWNQKITITVETPGGVKSGASVMEVIVAEKRRGILFNPPEARGVGSVALGEAVVVDLGGGRYLFGLLSGMDKAAQCALTWEGDWWPDGARAVSRFDGVAQLPVKCQPRLVTFDDINDPASVKRVDPDNLSASFGDNHALQSITLEMTREVRTEGKVEAVLGWWCNYRNNGASPNGSTSIAVFTNELSDTLGTGAFRVGECS